GWPEQIKTARANAKAAGVSDRVEFREWDYRQLTGQFDRVVSVGMMEHVGIGHFDEYFLKIRELLTPDGYAFIHCIGRMSQPGTTGPFIRKYIPGWCHLRRTVLPDVGILSRRRRTRIPAWLAHGVSIAAVDQACCGADRARFYGRRRAGGLRDASWMTD